MSEFDILVTDYYQDYCPVCGGKIIHPHTGLVTTEQLEEESKCCTWIEVQDENNYTIGYNPICKNIHYTTDENGNISFNLLDIINSDKTHDIDYKIDLVKKILKHYLGEDFEVVVEDGKITGISESITAITLELSLDEEGNLVLK